MNSTEKSQVRVRFAPSPTGMMHIGNIRTGLYNWLLARHTGGVFILRIEDTDRERSTKESAEGILQVMKWLSLNFDEGPFFQSQRFHIYKEYADRLISEGKAYRCYCTQEELDAMREAARAKGDKPMYDGRCRNRNPKTDWPNDKPYVVRFKSPDEGETSFDDAVRGTLTFDNKEIDDLVIIRSDGTPTYNFSVVVDDSLMGVTHVIRGEDHITNTPRQIQLYRAFGKTPPVFGHLPLILNKERKPYSKRDGLAGVEEFRKQGFLPSALINYIARLGWGHGDDEILPRDKLIEYFSLEGVNKSGAVFDMDKLLWLNQHYMKETPDEELAKMLAEKLQASGFPAQGDMRLPVICKHLKERTKTINEMRDMALMFYDTEVNYDSAAIVKFINEAAKAMLKELSAKLETLSPFTEEGVKAIIEAYMSEKQLNLKKVAQPLRVALTGSTISPGIYETIALMGKERTIGRIQKLFSHIEAVK